MIALTLVTGFLGSGKTTLLRNMLGGGGVPGDRAIAFVVNEFADEDVDGRALAAADARVMTVLGGSIFCECRAADFVEVLLLLPRRVPGLEAVVVEVSGMANPKSIGTLLRKSGLDRLYRVARVVSVVDPVRARILLETLPVFREQLEASDLILINKCDCYDEAEIAAGESAVRVVAPGVPAVRTCYAKMPDVEATGRVAALDASLVPCAPPEFCTIVLHGPCSMTVRTLEARLEGFSESLYRVKGAVRCADGYFGREFDGVRWRECRGAEADGSLVVIAAREAGHLLEGAFSGAFAVEAEGRLYGARYEDLLT